MKIVIKVTIKIKKNRKRIRILVNSDIETNYIKKRLALNIGIILILRAIPLFLLEERKIYLYRNYILGITIKDILENRKKADI
jgi:hypothetical protein